MPELSHIDPRSAALLVMDYQVDTLTKFMTAAQSADAIARVPDEFDRTLPPYAMERISISWSPTKTISPRLCRLESAPSRRNPRGMAADYTFRSQFMLSPLQRRRISARIVEPRPAPTLIAW
jgi:hypothetical protein